MSEKTIRALVVDDSVTIRKILKNNLSKFGIAHCDEASDGKAAWQLMLKCDYDLVLTDYNMPEMNGVDFAKKISEGGEKFAKVRIAAVSSAFSKELILQFKKFGVDTFLVKPFNLEMFNEAISSLLPSLDTEQDTDSSFASELSKLFEKNSPKTTFDGKNIVLDFGEEKIYIDAGAIPKTSIKR